MTGFFRSFCFYKPFFIWKNFVQKFEHDINFVFFYRYAQIKNMKNVSVLKVTHNV